MIAKQEIRLWFEMPAMQPKWLRALTQPLSLLYLMAVTVRRQLYKKQWLQSHTLPGRTISIGNITVGGTGKTPFAIDLAAQLLQQGAKPVILTRGYGSRLSANEFCYLHHDTSYFSAERRMLQADEAQLQAKRLPEVPIVIGRRRYKAAQWFLSTATYQVSHWILDDGFQHLNIRRDIDIVLLNATNPFSNSWTLPAGLLREPIGSLGEADLVVWTKGARPHGEFPLGTAEEHVCPYVFVPPHLPDAPESLLETSQRILVIAAIGDTQTLLRNLGDQGFKTENCCFLPDHQSIDLVSLGKRMQNIDAIVTTYKDYYRDPEVFTKCNKPTYLCDLRAQIPKLIVATCLR